MIRTYRNSQPHVIFLVVFTAAVAWIPVFIKPALFYKPINTDLSPLLSFSGFHDQLLPGWSSMALGFLSWMLLAFMISQINAKHLFLEARNYLPALFFLLSAIWEPGMQQLNPAVLGLFFVVLGVDRIFISIERTKIGYSYFDAGFFMALASLFYLPYLLFLVITWFAIILFRSIKTRNFLNALIGFIAPWWLVYGLVFFFKGNLTELNAMFLEILPGNQGIKVNLYQIVLFSVVGFSILVASLNLASSPAFKKVRLKRYFYLFFWNFIILVAGSFFLFGHKPVLLVAIAMPVSYLLANYYSHIKPGILAQGLFLSFILVMVGYPYLLLIFP